MKRWLVIAAITQLPLAMVFPFSQVFAYEIKGATPFILGAMVTGSALLSIVFAIPLGRLADMIGRKKILYATVPLFWVSNLLLGWAPNATFLILPGMLPGFFYTAGPTADSGSGPTVSSRTRSHCASRRSVMLPQGRTSSRLPT